METARLLRWDPDGADDELLSSGFGPFALTRLCRETGGVYYLLDDEDLPGPLFTIDDLAAHAPDYGPRAEYGKSASANKLRMSVLSVSATLNESLPQPQTRFLAAGIQFEIRDTKQTLAQASALLDQALDALRAAEPQRAAEKSPRWRAHYDLLVGRILAHQVRCAASVPLLDEMYAHPQVPQDVTKNAWQLAGADGTDLAAGSGDNPRLKPWSERAAEAREHLQRVVAEHPRTPWAALAEQELQRPLVFQWQEALTEPPQGEKLPWENVPWEELTEEQKAAVAKFQQRRQQRQQRQQARQEAQQRVPQL